MTIIEGQHRNNQARANKHRSLKVYAPGIIDGDRLDDVKLNPAPEPLSTGSVAVLANRLLHFSQIAIKGAQL
jgi:hypothetical protein